MAIIVMKMFEFATREDLNDFIENERNTMYTIIWEAIESAFVRGDQCAYILEIWIEDEKLEIDMISHRPEWTDSLAKAMEYYTETEEYEKCGKLKVLIERIRNESFLEYVK